MLDKSWHIYLGDSWIGTLHPTTEDGDWIVAEFEAGDAWGNFAPWFQKAAAAYNDGDDAEWDKWYGQLTAMGLVIVADDEEAYDNPVILVDGAQAWFSL